MATLVIRGLDERVKPKLRTLAARQGVSLEEYARDILERAVLVPPPNAPFVRRIRQRFEALAIDALPVPARQQPRAALSHKSLPAADWCSAEYRE